MTMAPGISLAGRQAPPAAGSGTTPHPGATATDGEVVAALQHWLPGQNGAQRSIGARLRQLVQDWMAIECRAIVDRRLQRMPEAARAALLPSTSAGTGLVCAVLRGLHPAALAGLLSPAVEEERALLLRLSGMGDPMLREAALDALFGTPRVGAARADVRAGCLALLRPGLALLCADVEPAPSLEEDSQGATQVSGSREMTILAALQRDDADGAVRMLALHAGVDEAQVQDAVWTRDARSLFGLAWRAGYSMRAALLLQTRLAGIPRPLALGPTIGGGSPLGRGEIAWQLAMLAAV